MWAGESTSKADSPCLALVMAALNRGNDKKRSVLPQVAGRLGPPSQRLHPRPVPPAPTSFVAHENAAHISSSPAQDERWKAFLEFQEKYLEVHRSSRKNPVGVSGLPPSTQYCHNSRRMSAPSISTTHTARDSQSKDRLWQREYSVEEGSSASAATSKSRRGSVGAPVTSTKPSLSSSHARPRRFSQPTLKPSTALPSSAASSTSQNEAQERNVDPAKPGASDKPGTGKSKRSSKDTQTGRSQHTARPPQSARVPGSERFRTKRRASVPLFVPRASSRRGSASINCASNDSSVDDKAEADLLDLEHELAGIQQAKCWYQKLEKMHREWTQKVNEGAGRGKGKPNPFGSSQSSAQSARARWTSEADEEDSDSDFDRRNDRKGESLEEQLRRRRQHRQQREKADKKKNVRPKQQAKPPSAKDGKRDSNSSRRDENTDPRGRNDQQNQNHGGSSKDDTRKSSTPPAGYGAMSEKEQQQRFQASEAQWELFESTFGNCATKRSIKLSDVPFPSTIQELVCPCDNQQVA